MDGADAVMLSAETSVGDYALKSVQAVEKILGSTELGWDIYNKIKNNIIIIFYYYELRMIDFC